MRNNAGNRESLYAGAKRRVAKVPVVARSITGDRAKPGLCDLHGKGFCLRVRKVVLEGFSLWRNIKIRDEMIGSRSHSLTFWRFPQQVWKSGTTLRRMWIKRNPGGPSRQPALAKRAWHLAQPRLGRYLLVSCPNTGAADACEEWELPPHTWRGR